MKKFLRRCFLFSIPFVIILVSTEVIVGGIPNSYSYKYNYIKQHGNEIRALALGHSQLYDGFMPEVFSIPSFNLCNSDQNYIDDYYLLQELLPDMPNLEMVILPIGYMNVSDIPSDTSLTERSSYYHKYMGLDYDGHLPLCYHYECLQPYKAITKVISYYYYHEDIVGCDSLGRRNQHSLRDRKNKLGAENIIRGYTCKQHDGNKLCIKYESYLRRILNMLTANDIKVVMVSPPYFWNCGVYRANEEQKKFFEKYMAHLKDAYPIMYLDLESDTLFTDADFFNETHLSDIGAEKFTKAVDRFLFADGKMECRLEGDE